MSGILAVDGYPKKPMPRENLEALKAFLAERRGDNQRAGEQGSTPQPNTLGCDKPWLRKRGDFKEDLPVEAVKCTDQYVRKLLDGLRKDTTAFAERTNGSPEYGEYALGELKRAGSMLMISHEGWSPPQNAPLNAMFFNGHLHPVAEGTNYYRGVVIHRPRGAILLYIPWALFQNPSATYEVYTLGNVSAEEVKSVISFFVEKFEQYISSH